MFIFDYIMSKASLKKLENEITCHIAPTVSRFKVYYVSHLENWSNKNKIDNDATLNNFLGLVWDDDTRKAKIIFSIGEDSPQKQPQDEELTAISSVSGIMSRNSGVTDRFHHVVLTRDESKCVFCGITGELQAAHVVDVQREVDAHYVLGEIDIYDVRNGITLCYPCHQAFDGNRICVRVRDPSDNTDLVIEVGDSLLAHDLQYNNKWMYINGKNVTVPATSQRLRSWPFVDFFIYRCTVYDKENQNRREYASKCSFVCTSCHSKFKTDHGLDRHRGSAACKKRIAKQATSRKLSAWSTPKKVGKETESNV